MKFNKKKCGLMKIAKKAAKIRKKNKEGTIINN